MDKNEAGAVQVSEDSFAVVTEPGGVPVVTSAAPSGEKFSLIEVLDEIAAGTDEYSGRGGSYVMDPDTQTRKPNPSPP